MLMCVIKKTKNKSKLQQAGASPYVSKDWPKQVYKVPDPQPDPSSQQSDLWPRVSVAT